MKKVTKRGAMVTGIAAVLAASALIVPAFAADSASTADEIVRGGEPDGDVQYPGKEYIVENYEKWDQIAEDYAPEVRQLPERQTGAAYAERVRVPELDAAKLDHFVQHVLPRRRQDGAASCPMPTSTR